MENIRALRGPLLRSVSRSFYLSIRLLPAKLRDPIGLAYLLARATDTIADTAEIDPELRTVELARLAARIQGSAASEHDDSLGEFVALQKDESERRLIEALPSCLAWLEEMPAADRADIRDVLVKINQGQTLDLERFGAGGSIKGLATAADLDRYTYLVAGCVGEFWTKICFRHLPRFSGKPVDEMLSLGIEYGKGLQLINILRDVGADSRAGRCYLPADELEPAAPRERVELVLNKWRERAENGIAAGLEYACAIRSARVRLATALPALLGARTLALLREAGATVFEEKIKINRAEVRQILMKTIRTLASPSSLRATFERLSS